MIKVIKYFQSLSLAKKSAIAFMFAGFVQQAINLLVTPLFTRLLSTEDFGVVTVYNSWVEIIGTIATLSLFSGMFSVGMVDYERERDRLSSSMLGLSVTSTVIVMAVFWAANYLLPNAIGLPMSLMLLMTIYFLTFPATQFWQARQRFEYKYKAMMIVCLITALLSPACGLLLVIFSKDNLGIARLVGTNSVIILIGLFFCVYLLCKDRHFFDKEKWTYALKFAIPLVPHYLAMHILSASDRVMIKSFVGEYEAGIYGLAYTASMIITVAWTAINGALTPYVLTKLKEDKLDEIESVSFKCITIFSVMCLCVVIVAPEVIAVLGGAKYSESVNLIPPLIAAVLFMEMYNLFSSVEFFHKKTIPIMFATMASAIINVGLNYVCIVKFGYRAAAYTTLFCYVLYCLAHYINMKKAEPRKIYDWKKLLILSALYCSLCFICMFLYGYPFVRYGIIAAIIVLAIVLRKKIKMNLQRIKIWRS